MEKKVCKKIIVDYYKEEQMYKEIPLHLIIPKDYDKKGAKRFMIGDPKYNQYV